MLHSDDGAIISAPASNGGPGNLAGSNNQHAVMLGVQGARLGMDLSLEMLHGVRQLGRVDIFRKIYSWVCDYSGLLHGGNAASSSPGSLNTHALVDSVEAQSSVLVAVRTAVEVGEDLDIDCWKRLFGLLFELRDAHILPNFLLRESEEDLLHTEQRKQWTAATVNGDMSGIVAALAEVKKRKMRQTSKASTMLGAFGRAIFGVDEPEDSPGGTGGELGTGKEDIVIWDEFALSDDEGDGNGKQVNQEGALEAEFGEDIAHLSPGAMFEAQLIRENINMDQNLDMPVTGLERADETHQFQRSARARLRGRLENSCQLESLISDSRYLDDESIKQCLMALMDLLPNGPQNGKPTVIDPSKFSTPAKLGMGDRSVSDVSISTASFAAISNWSIPVSPASEAFAEVLICEIALKNRDRLKMLWSDLLHDHYVGRLAKPLSERSTRHSQGIVAPDPGLEKRLTGLIRLSVCSTKRNGMANEILSTWQDILPISQEQEESKAPAPLETFHQHLSEGLWRMVSNADGLLSLRQSGWDGLVSLFNWCATRSCSLPALRIQSSVLDEYDSAVQTYRSLHLLMNSADLESAIPCSLIDSMRTLVAAGDTRNYPQLCLASLDLIQMMNEKKVRLLNEEKPEKTEEFCSLCWRRIVEALAEAAEHPRMSVSLMLGLALARV